MATMERCSSEGEASDLSLEEYSNASAEDFTPVSPAWPTISDVHRILRPLQATADRVGKQVEEFAETLDRLSKSRREKPGRDCTHALAIVEGYRRIAQNTVEHLQAIDAPKKQGKPGGNWRDRLRKTESAADSKRRQSEDHNNATTVEDLARWEQEEHTWHLLGLMLQVEYPSSAPNADGTSSDERLIRPNKGKNIHHYSSEYEVWLHFLAHDDQAWERHTVVEWLKVCANDSDQEIEQVIRELEEDADRGSGLWAHSWLFTKEAIKGQKRLRSWPQALVPDSPGIDSSLRNTAHTESLVTQLDPDAITRQDRGLQPQDTSFERATWMACWDMLRRGRDWQFIRTWCKERVENWRAIATRGDPRQHGPEDGETGRYPDGNASWQSRALWRKASALAARTGGMDKYEAAVYGVLSGYLPAVQKVCDSWNDYLFAHYNSYLLRSFDQHVAANFADRLPVGLRDREGPFDFNMTGGRHTQSGNQLVKKMRRLKPLADEAKDPMKQLQGSLIGKTFDSFVHKNGLQLLRERHRQKKESKPPYNAAQANPEDGKEPLIRLDDYQLLRMVTHIMLVYQDFEHSWVNKARSKAAEAFIEAYIDFLGQAGKQQILPLYASRLSPRSAIRSLSRQLPRILDYGERRTVMQLMKQHGIDVPSVLSEQLWMIMKEIEAKIDYDTDDRTYPTLHMLEIRHDEQRIGACSIRDDFIGHVITDEQHDLINGFEWYLLLDGYWEKTLATGAVLYKHFLKLPHSQGLAAARELSRRVSFSTLSRNKARAILGREIDISDILDEEDGALGNQGTALGLARASGHGNERSRTHSRPEKERYLFQQSNSFLELEQLMQLLGAFEEWQAAVKEQPRSTGEGASIGKPRRDQVKKAYELVEACIQPLLHGWLQHPHDDNEASELEEIRKACLPEVVLTYIVILNSSAQYISRDLLLKSLEMAAAVASRDSDLAPCFVSSGRMPELVDTLAFTSATTLLADECGRGKKRNSARLGVWSTKGPLHTVV